MVKVQRVSWSRFNRITGGIHVELDVSLIPRIEKDWRRAILWIELLLPEEMDNGLCLPGDTAVGSKLFVVGNAACR